MLDDRAERQRREEGQAAHDQDHADHETDEGYFSLGKDATVMAKPGTELYQFLARQKGRQVRVTMTLVDGRQLSRIER